MRTLCLGDSFTKGYGVDRDKNWVSLLDTPCSTFINKGISGDTTSGMLTRLNTEVKQENPNYLLITGGINDFISGSSLEIPQNNYMSMVHQSFHYQFIPIVGIQPDFDPAEVRKDWASFMNFYKVKEKLEAFRSWQKEFCKAFGLFYIDFYGDFQKVKEKNPDEQYYLDGLHLSENGHAEIAKIVVNALRSME